MRISAFVIPFFVLLAGVFGYNLRLSERRNVFDSVTGLPYRDAATTFWLTALSIAFILFIIIFAIRVAVKYKASKGFEGAFGTDPVFYPIVFVIIGVTWILGTLMYLFNLLMLNAISLNDVYFVVFSTTAAISLIFFSIEMYQDSRRNAAYILSVIPTIFMCFWLIFLYRHNASNPILMGYIYQCLAIVTSTLGFYFTSGFLYGRQAPGKAVVAYYASVYFCMVTLADDIQMGIRLIYCALIAINLVHATMLIRNLQKKQGMGDVWHNSF